MRSRRLPLATAALLVTLALGACSPTYNWRESSDNGAHFVVLLPGKPASVTRSVDLNGPKVDMNMTAAEVDGSTFAVGTAELGDAAAAGKAIDAMATALLNNIGGKPDAATVLPGKTDGYARVIDIDARGVVRGRPQRLVARLAARDRRVYQILILGEDKAVTDEIVETFFASFKPT
ncbi:hypothetical protein J8I26_13135 [Herbaspirillum sp. LeCh32-8]|uniref:hypothetical protein n=1 Tax=Herbaspirillum sp. LeCh32-8 TaxID=2821356 RepID=UPI001AE48515|nr:hypothetical protein [Herbaspirillum sp. LeCh32-8]MBP0599060.1 hypothetical protein [Herbaspirillum sp. LeCh32-8]